MFVVIAVVILYVVNCELCVIMVTLCHIAFCRIVCTVCIVLRSILHSVICTVLCYTLTRSVTLCYYRLTVFHRQSLSPNLCNRGERYTK
jgi:hypothetical protein